MRRASIHEIEIAAARARDALNGHFRFLNLQSTFGRPIDWAARAQPRLWRFKLHYFDYLVDLAATRTGEWDAITSLLREWMDRNPLGHDADAWHPFVVSERIVNWMFAAFYADRSTPLDNDIAESLALQCAFVEDNLETDVGGNHLLKNLKALAVAGCFWSGPLGRDWAGTYVDSFTRELQNQILADGGHYERSPMYHSLVLQDALEVAAIVRATGAQVSPMLLSTIRSLCVYLDHVTFPDGEIALFNDSVYGEAPSPASLQAFARHILDGENAFGLMTVRQAMLCGEPARPTSSVAPWTPRASEDSGLVRVPLSLSDGFALIDVGRACPDDLPAHAHADFFSYELSLGAHRVIADSGVGQYQAGPWRDYFRSTRAHNTLAVDGEDQIECWASFRVARRARILSRHTIDAPLARGVISSHDGYARLHRGLSVTRAFVALDDRAWVVLDRVHGSGAHRWESFIHAAPGVSIAMADERSAGCLVQGERLLSLAWFGADTAVVISGSLDPIQGWYSSEFGRVRKADVLALGGASPPRADCGYVLAPGLAPAEIAIDSSSEGVRVRLADRRYLLRFEAGRLSAILG